MECGFDTHKNALIKNLVILFAFFCAVEPIYSFFKPIGFFDLIIIRCILMFSRTLIHRPAIKSSLKLQQNFFPTSIIDS